MKIRVSKQNLMALLSKTQNIVEKKTTMPILINVLLHAKEGKLQVFATDLEVSLTDQTDVQIEEEGRVAVHAKNLFEIIKELGDGEITLDTTQKPKKEDKEKGHLANSPMGHRLKIKQAKSLFNIIGVPPDEYPVFPTFKTNDFIEVNPKVFLEMIDRTIYSVSSDETRYHLNGVYFEKKTTDGKTQFRMVATDGHRLSLVDRFTEDETANIIPSGVIIPRKGLSEVKKIIDFSDEPIQMAVEGSQLVVKAGSTLLMVRLIEGKYPNYQQLIPDNLNKTALIRRDSLLSSIKRVSLLSSHKSKGVTIALDKGKMEISSNNAELGDAKEEIDVDYQGEKLKIGFNAKYILDILNSFQDDNLSLNLKNQGDPGLIQPEADKDYTCIIMPMRL